MSMKEVTEEGIQKADIEQSKHFMMLSSELGLGEYNIEKINLHK